MRYLIYALPFALTVFATNPVSARETPGAKAAAPGASAQEFSSSRRKYSGPRGGGR
ncbi:MAG: hypothetical protein ACI8R4_000065 [Paracoccaceae bacterium]|jgi:hypothetical protein